MCMYFTLFCCEDMTMKIKKYSSAALLAAMALGVTVPVMAADETPTTQATSQNGFYDVRYDTDAPSVTLGKQATPYIIFKLPTKDGEIVRYLRLNSEGYLLDIPEISLNSVTINGSDITTGYTYTKEVIDTSKKYTPGETYIGHSYITVPSSGSSDGGTYDSTVAKGVSVDGDGMPETPWTPSVDTTPIKVTNVAAGAIAKDSSDAINGSQLFEAMQSGGKTYTAGTNITISDSNVISATGTGTSTAGDTGLITGDTLYQTVNNINTTTNTALANKADKNAGNLTADDITAWQGKLGNGQNKAGDTGLITGDTLHTAINSVSGDITNINNALTSKADINLSNITNDGKTVIRDLAKESVKVVNGTNTTVTTGTDGDATTYAVNVSADAIKGAVQADLDKKANTDASNLSNTDVSKWQEKLGTGTISEGNTGLVTGGTVYEVVKNVSGESLVKTDGNTVSIDKTGTATTIDVSHTNKDGQTEGRVITGINTDADDPTSAANVGYVNSTANALSNKMDSGFTKLGKQVKNVGANAAALAALHPQDFDEDYKFSVAAGVGNYKGKNGTAIGAFYRPNQDLMFSVGGTLGDDAMVNAGISYKFGHSDTSKKVVNTSELDAINKKLDELAEQNARLRTQNERLLNLIYRIKPKREAFPDVPSNHWAAEAVETLHANDVIKGYPDGEFKGDQKMSRYEYAEMLYNSLPKKDDFTK